MNHSSLSFSCIDNENTVAINWWDKPASQIFRPWSTKVTISVTSLNWSCILNFCEKCPLTFVIFLRVEIHFDGPSSTAQCIYLNTSKDATFKVEHQSIVIARIKLRTITSTQELNKRWSYFQCFLFPIYIGRETIIYHKSALKNKLKLFVMFMHLSWKKKKTTSLFHSPKLLS